MKYRRGLGDKTNMSNSRIMRTFNNKTYRPLPQNLTIKESKIDGLGLHVKEEIEGNKGKDIKVEPRNVTIYDIQNLENNIEENTSKFFIICSISFNSVIIFIINHFYIFIS